MLKHRRIYGRCVIYILINIFSVFTNHSCLTSCSLNSHIFLCHLFLQHYAPETHSQKHFGHNYFYNYFYSYAVAFAVFFVYKKYFLFIKNYLMSFC